MRRSCRWMALEGGGLEHLVLDLQPDGVRAEGVVIGAEEGRAFACAYAIRCDASWRVRAVDVRIAGGPALALRADGAGHWTDADGRTLPELDGCIDVDLRCSAFTNTLPIRRLGEGLAQRQEILVAYVDVLADPLAAHAQAQAYVCLAPDRYRFESLDSGFSAELTVDGDALVLDYPSLFRRIAA